MIGFAKDPFSSDFMAHGVLLFGLFILGCGGTQVMDIGVGIDPTVFDKLFIPFFTIFTTKPDGMGMGLS